MRVIAGSRRSLPLKAPTGMDTRPTQDRTKETLFNIINNNIYDCTFLDIFSGSGGIAIEALSRGAGRAVLIEKNRNAIACIRENIKFTRFENESECLEEDVFTAIPKLKGRYSFDIIFMDPPYKAGLEERVLETIAQNNIAHEDTIIIVEAALDTGFDFVADLGMEVYRTKKYKTNQHVFIRFI